MCLILDKTAQTFSVAKKFKTACLAKKFKTASSLSKPAPESFFFHCAQYVSYIV